MLIALVLSVCISVCLFYFCFLFICCLFLVACLGKWTTYRSMAQDTVDRLVQVAGLEDKTGCMTDGFLLDGGEGWHPTNFIRLIQDYGIDIEVRNTKTSVPLASTIIQNLALILYLDLVISQN